MAAGATMRTLQVALSDVDRGVYEAFDLRLAQHPSESLGYLWSRVLAYCLSYEDDIDFSKAGLSDPDEPPVAVRSLDGVLHKWIDVGSPSADRLHKASKAAGHVSLYSTVSLDLLRKEAGRRKVHRLDEIEVWSLPTALIDELGERSKRAMTLELVRTENQLYVTINDTVIESQISLHRLTSD